MHIEPHFRNCWINPTNGEINRRYFLKHYWNLENVKFYVWPKIPEQVVKYGNYSLKWTLSDISPKSYGEYHRYNGTIKKLVSFDNRFWKEEAVLKPYIPRNSDGTLMYPKQYSEQAITLDALIKKASNDARLKFNRDKARDKREVEKQTALKLGVTVKELRQQKSLARSSRPTRQEVENLKRIIEVGPVLKSLKDELEFLLEKMNEDSKNVKIVYVQRYTRELRQAIGVCREWGRK